MKKEMRLIFTGDLMLGGDFYDNEINKNNFSIDLMKTLNKADAIITNFENVINSSNDIRIDKSLLLFCSEKTLRSYYNLFPKTVINLGNNHITDFNNSGFLRTINILKKYNIKYYGAGTAEQAGKPLLINNNIILLNFSTDHLFVRSKIAKENEIGCLPCDQERITEILKKVNKENFIIITFHWGEIDNTQPSKQQISLAHKVIDLGADLVIGHHPHILQPIEIYKEKYIFYSLGNFFFPNFYGFKTGVYYSWPYLNNLSILVQVKLTRAPPDKDYKINIYGIEFLKHQFIVKLNDKSIKFLNIISKRFNNDITSKQKQTDNIYNTNNVKEILYHTLYIFNCFKKNKYSYFWRLRKFLTIKTLRFYIDLLSNLNNYRHFNSNVLNFFNNNIINFSN